MIPSANATGVYSGIVANGNGAGSEDASNIVCLPFVLHC